MRWRAICLAAMAVGMGTLSAEAGLISISFDDPADSAIHDILWNPLDPSPSMVIGLENGTDASDPLFGWQLGLQIVPETGATGGLLFKSAGMPPAYIFEGRTDGLTLAFAGPNCHGAR
jgi:hypothetical protein